MSKEMTEGQRKFFAFHPIWKYWTEEEAQKKILKEAGIDEEKYYTGKTDRAEASKLIGLTKELDEKEREDG